MHAYRKFLEDQLEAHKMTPAEFSRASGISEQRISQMRKDKRERLNQAPDKETVRKIAEGFKMEPDEVWAFVAEAMGLPSSVAPSITHEVKDVTHEQLLKELGHRLGLEVTVRPASQAGSPEKIPHGSGAPLTSSSPVEPSPDS